MANWYEDLAKTLDPQPADLATIFAGARSAIPVYAAMGATGLNEGEDEALRKLYGPIPKPSMPPLSEEDEQSRMIADFERQFPTPELRRAALQHMRAVRSNKAYDPATATRRVDFMPQGTGPEMRATPLKARNTDLMRAPPVRRAFAGGGSAKKTVQQMADELTAKGAGRAKSATKTTASAQRASRNLLSSSLDAEKLARALGVSIKEAPSILPQSENTKNLRKFTKPSAVQHRVFHGSNVPESIVEDSQFVHYEPDATEIHWFATDPSFAERYTSKYMESPGEQGAIFPAHIQVRNPLEIPFDLDSKLTSDVWKYAQDLGLSKAEFKEWRKEHDFDKATRAWQVIDSPQFRSAAMSKGYDGIKAPEDGFETFGVFDVNRIKSQFNQGTYDTKTPDIGKKEGGAVIPPQGFQKGGSAKKTVQQMADELLMKGTKVADKPDLARRSLFGLKAQPAMDFPLARIDDKALTRLEK